MITVTPQGYPLWPVRACSIDDTEAEIGLVVGWEHVSDTAIRRPVVATLGSSNAPWRGAARDWTDGVERSDRPGTRWVERVEIYPTLQDAADRTADLFREVGEEHDALWPEDAPSPATSATPAAHEPEF